MPKRNKTVGNAKYKNQSTGHGKKPGKSGSSTNPNRILTDKQKVAIKSHNSNLRSKSDINRLNMMREKPNYENMNKQSLKPARI